MKLKLESLDSISAATSGITILTISEAVDVGQVAILKAGLGKLLAAGKKSVLLDFTDRKAYDFASPELFSLISDFRFWGASEGAQILVASSMDRFGHVKTREEGIHLLSAGITAQEIEQAKLHLEMKSLHEKKAALEKTFQTAQSFGDVQALKKQNSALKKSLLNVESLTRRFLKNRPGDPLSSGHLPDPLNTAETSPEALHDLLCSVLKKEGVLA